MLEDDYPAMLTVKDIQDILRVGVVSSYHLLHSGHFPAVRIGRAYRVPRDEFFSWLRQSNIYHQPTTIAVNAPGVFGELALRPKAGKSKK